MSLLTKFSSGSIQTPEGQKLKIYQNGSDITSGKAELIIEDAVTLSMSSTFDNLVPSFLTDKMTTLLSVSSSAIGGSVGQAGISGQFQEQSFQVWKSTAPIELSFSCSLSMKINAKIDVYDPVIKICKLALPAEGTIGLIAPGPSIVEAIRQLSNRNGFVGEGANFVDEAVGDVNENVQAEYLSVGDGSIKITVGNYLSLEPVIITKAVPQWSSVLDENGYPVWATLEISLRTANVATKQMLERMGGFQ